jgi:GH24 family phage-related lysozyme (muramidase)
MSYLSNAFRYYKSEPHQNRAIAFLEGRISPKDLEIFRSIYSPPTEEMKLSAVPDCAIELIKEFEGCHRLGPDGMVYAYADPLHGWSVPTIGFGTTRYPDGSKVAQGDSITEEECDALLRYQLETVYLPGLKRIPNFETWSPEMVGAMLSFGYNLGANFYDPVRDGFRTISKCLRDRRYEDVPKALELYRNPGSATERGLLRRRRAEGALWAKGLQPSNL